MPVSSFDLNGSRHSAGGTHSAPDLALYQSDHELLGNESGGFPGRVLSAPRFGCTRQLLLPCI